MSSAAQKPDAPTVESIRSELGAVLSSELFARAPSLAQFLSYVCRKAIQGESDQIKEYSIAVEALGRPSSFDQKEDAIVRVEAHRLRKRLKQYYETLGQDHALQIVIPAGQYVPLFIPRIPETTVPAPAATVLELPPAEPVPASAEPSGKPLAPVIEILPPTEPPQSRPRRAFAPWAAASLLFLAVAAGAVWFSNQRSATPGRPVPPGGAVAAAVGTDEGIRIACGLESPSWVDSLGNAWSGDRYFVGGKTVSSPPERIARTRDAALFQHRREGDFHYRIPLKPGLYEVHLYFAERVFGPDNLGGGGETSRLFHLFANGVQLAEKMDVISDAAGSNTADVRVYTGLRPAADGFLDLHFATFKENAFVNGIEVLPAPEGKMRPVRILAGSSSFRDRAGNLWSGDQFSTGGQLIARPGAVSGTNEPEIYRHERHGNFSYVIPVAPGGRYSLNLHFVEAWFGPDKPSTGGVGSREFDVYCNGVALLRNFDIYKNAGGNNRALVKTFRGLSPNAQGKLALQFVPVTNYACLNAIEVLPE